MSALWKFIAISLISVVVFHYARLIRMFGFHKTVYNHSPGHCEVIEGIDYGSEDMQALPSGIVLISSGLDMPIPGLHPKYPRNGSIVIFDFNQPEKGARSLRIDGFPIPPEKFNPHGVSLWQEPDNGDCFLFVVNHLSTGDVIEKFRFHESTQSLEYIQSYYDEVLFGQLNDVLATGANSFYFTNHRYFHALDIEVYLNLKWGSVGYYDGKDARILVTGLALPNGINMSPSGSHVYLAVTAVGEIHVYDRLPDNSLRLKQTAFVDSAVDNIDVNLQSGDLWMGSHPISWKTLIHCQDTKFISPSQVLKMSALDGGAHLADLTEVYANNGSQLSGSASAIEFKGRMLVGTIANQLLLCDMRRHKD